MSPTTVAADYRKLLPLVLMAALRQAGTHVLEPTQRFEMDCPVSGLSEVLLLLTGNRATVEETVLTADQGRVVGTIPTAALRFVEQRLPGQAGGEASLASEFAGYQRVVGEPPSRPRTDDNPLNRKQYLAAVGRT